MAPGDVELVPLQSLGDVADALTAKRIDAAATAEPSSPVETERRGCHAHPHRDSLPWQIAVLLYADRFARTVPARGVHEGLCQASRHYFDSVLRHARPEYDEIVAITAKYTGARPELIRRGFPYQDRDGG